MNGLVCLNTVQSLLLAEKNQPDAPCGGEKNFSLNSGFAGGTIRPQWSCQPIVVLLPDCGKQASNQIEAWHEKNAEGRPSGVKGRLRKARLQSSKTRSLGSRKQILGIRKTDLWDQENSGKHAHTCFRDKWLKSPYLVSEYYPKPPKAPLNSPQWVICIVSLSLLLLLFNIARISPIIAFILVIIILLLLCAHVFTHTHAYHKKFWLLQRFHFVIGAEGKPPLLLFNRNFSNGG